MDRMERKNESVGLQLTNRKKVNENRVSVEIA